MRIAAELQKVIKGDRGMLRGIEACLKEECLVSAVSLIYAAIDSISALTRPIGQADTTANQFMDWVNKFLLQHSNLPCTATEFYGARCGILHTYSPESRLQRNNQGAVKRIIYQWKAGPKADAQIPLPADSRVVIVEDLFDALKSGIDQFLTAVDQDPKLEKVVKSNCNDLLCYTPFQVVADS